MLFHIFPLLSRVVMTSVSGLSQRSSDSNVITRPDRIIQSWPLPSVHISNNIKEFPTLLKNMSNTKGQNQNLDQHLPVRKSHTVIYIFWASLDYPVMVRCPLISKDDMIIIVYPACLLSCFIQFLIFSFTVYCYK